VAREGGKRMGPLFEAICKGICTFAHCSFSFSESEVPTDCAGWCEWSPKYSAQDIESVEPLPELLSVYCHAALLATQVSRHTPVGVVLEGVAP